MINDDDSIQNLSGLKLLESLDLGNPRKARKEESKEDNFEEEMNVLLQKLNNQISTIKNKTNNNYNFQLKPFNIDIDFDNSLNNINNGKENYNNNMNINNNNNSEQSILKNKNNKNDNNRAYILQTSYNDRDNANNNIKAYNNPITPTPEEDSKEIPEINNNNNNNNMNNNYTKNSITQNINNSFKNNESNNFNYPPPPNNNNKEDDFELDIEEIPEIDNNENNVNKDIVNNNNLLNNNNKIENNNLLNTNINPTPNENYKIDPNEIDLRDSDFQNNNNDLMENEKEKKEEEEKNKIEEEKKKQKEKEENEEREEIEVKSRNDEIEVKSQNDEIEEIGKKEKKEEKEDKDKNSEKREFSINNECKNDNKNNINDHENKEKEDIKKDEMNFDIEDIVSVETEHNADAPVSANMSGELLKNSKKNTKKNKQHKSESSKVKNEDSIEEIVQNDEKEKDKNKEKKDDLKQEKENEKEDEKEDEKEETIKNPKKRTNTMPENNQKLKNSSIKKDIKKSYTQKSNLIKIRATITKVEKDEESMPDLSNIEDYPTLTNFSKDEKALNEIIPDYKEKILDKEKKEEIQAKEYLLSNNKPLQDNFEEGENISQLIGNLETSHPDLMKNLYDEQQLKNLPEFQENLEEKIFVEDKNSEINCPIGGVENIDSYIQKYFLSNNNKIIETSKKFFLKWRRILGDGNSFYRILMFSLFEAYILSKNIEELNYLINEITSDEFIEVYKEKEIEYEICFSIFSILLNYLKNDNIQKAYKILLKSYLLEDNSFDTLLIVYIKHLIVKYINIIKDLIKKEGKNVDDNNKFNTYLIESPNIEPSFIIMCTIPYIFNINMNILTLKGELLKPTPNQINFVDPDEDSIPLITFGYFFSSFYKLYSPDFEKKYKYNLDLIDNNNKQLTYIIKDLKKCEKCGKETEHILFIEKKFIICKKCLEDHLSSICNFRADAFKEDGFLGLEYYTRPILICDNYYIDDLEIIELLESLNILNALCQKYNNNCTKCNNCQEPKNSDEIINFKCGCTFCQDCIEKMVSQMTNGLKCLNPAEKKELEDTKCICGKKYDIDEALKHIKHNKDDIKESSNRLKQYINTLCLTCNKELRSEDPSDPIKFNNINDNVKYRKLKIKKSNKNDREKNIEYMEIDHLICEQCYMKYFKKGKIEIEEEEEDDNEEEHKNDNHKPVDFENGTINCGICCRKHDLDAKVLNEGGCCTDCSIF